MRASRHSERVTTPEWVMLGKPLLCPMPTSCRLMCGLGASLEVSHSRALLVHKMSV